MNNSTHSNNTEDRNAPIEAEDFGRGWDKDCLRRHLADHGKSPFPDWSDAGWAKHESKFNASKAIYPGDWIRLAPDETQEGWQAALKQALEKPCEVCSEAMDGEEYLWYHRTRHAGRCPNCQEADWFADGYSIEDGEPHCWSHKHDKEQRIAERARNQLQKAASYRASKGQGERATLYKALLAREPEHIRHLIDELERFEKVPSPQPTEAKKTSPEGIVQLSTVEMLPIVFVDKPLFQANAFHLIVGKKNAGKGTFLSSVASRFTQGKLGEARNVIWVAAGEDSLSLDVRPRIEAAGGDTARVYCPSITSKLPEAIAHLREWVQKVGNVGLIVLDPISGMLRAGINTNLDSDVRSVIAPLNQLADDIKCLIVGVRHLRKDASQGALEAILGSADWANVPRAVLAIAMDDQDEDIRHVQVVAGNRVPRGTASRSFRIVGARVVEGGEPVAKAEFINGEGKDVDEMLKSEPVRSNSRTRQTKMAMLDLLEDASDSGDSIESNALTDQVMAAVNGITPVIIKKAKDWLKEKGLIKFFPDKDEDGKILQWNIKRTSVPRPEELQDQSAEQRDEAGRAVIDV
jgi:hypothetical protein